MPRKKATSTDSLGRKQPTTRRGFGAVEQRASGNWRARYIGPDRNRYYAPRTFATKGDAEAWLAVVRSEIQREVWKPPTTVKAEKLGAYARLWLEQKRKPNGEELAPRTKAQYARIIEKQLVPLADYRLGDLTAPVVRNWHQSIEESNGGTTAGIATRCLATILNQAVADELITRNPIPKGLGATSSKVPHRPPTIEELAGLYSWFSSNAPRLKLALLLASYGGLRLSEWRALRRKDLELTNDGYYVVKVERQAQWSNGRWLVTAPKSEAGAAAVTLAPWLTEAVTHHLETFTGQFPDSLLFEATDNEIIKARGAGEFISTAWQRAWNAARDSVGIRGEVREHDLRGYYGTYLAAKGAGIKQIQGALRHSTPTASLVYLAEVKGANRAIADLFEPLSVVAPSNVKLLEASR